MSTSIWNTDSSKEIKHIPEYPPQGFQTSMTSLVQVYNFCARSASDNYYYYRWRECDTGLTTNTPAAQYQKQKLIQNTVRVYSSEYTMNLGSLAGYQRPNKRNAYVPWNQMSDRAEPAKQKAGANGGNTIGSSSTRHSITRLRPGSLSPGGIGCDIKHNSYDRYLNRLKGKAPLRRGIIPPNFGMAEIEFNRANPIYGGKVMKTSIVSGCNCPIVTDQENYKKLYVNPVNETTDNVFVPYHFSVGEKIFININGKQTVAIIEEDLGNGNFVIKLGNGSTMIANKSNFLVYYNCSSHIDYVGKHERNKDVASFETTEGNVCTSTSGDVVVCQKLNGSISNITAKMRFFPELPENINVDNIFSDDGYRWVNGVLTPSYPPPAGEPIF